MTTTVGDQQIRWRETLQRCHDEMKALANQPACRGPISGVQDLDLALWRVGGEMLDSAAEVLRPETAEGPDVYLASSIHEEGGHTALIGDFVTALQSEHSRPRQTPHLILTLQASSPATESIARAGIPEANIELLQGDYFEERLQQLIEKLAALQPERLFLFHHPLDPLPSAAAHRALARQIFLVHHADASPSFGLYLPGVRIIDLNPSAAANSHLQSLSSELLLLTCPDPGPRPQGFLQSGGLTTASCGSQHKFMNDIPPTYPETIRLILEHTRGRHFHFGPLDEVLLGRIRAGLREGGVPQEKFVHVPWVRNLARALWENGCDVYLSSFPIDGARVNVEVAASGTPHLRRAKAPLAPVRPFTLRLRGSLAWHTPADLVAILKDVTKPGVLEELSREIRGSYDQFHHPAVFQRTLDDIVKGRNGVRDPDAAERDAIAGPGLFRTSPGTVATTVARHLVEDGS